MEAASDRWKALEFLWLERSSIVPHYQQLADQLLKAILDGRLNPGDPLPSERELSRQLGISRMTVRRSLTDLEALGRLVSRVGKGWFVSSNKIEQTLTQLTGFSADMRALDLNVESRVIFFAREPASDWLAEQMRVRRGETIYHLERLRIVNGDPIGIERPYVAERVCPGLERYDFSVQSLYTVMRTEYGLTLARAEQQIEASTPDPGEAAMLGIDEDQPVLRGMRLTFSPEDIVLEASTAVYRGDRYKYQLLIQGNTQAGGLMR